MHMKLQRKKKKAEEKARLEAEKEKEAASALGVVGGTFGGGLASALGKVRLKRAINITKKENAKERSTVVIICLKNGPGELSRDFCCIVSRR